MEPKKNPHIKPEAGRAKIPVHFIVIFFVCLCSFALSGYDEESTTFSDQNKAAWQACIDTGGVPVRSAWSSQVADCLYKGD